MANRLCQICLVPKCDENLYKNITFRKSVHTGIVSKYARYLVERGVPGVLVNGTNGEGPSMSVQERKENTEAWISAAKETKQHIMVQIGGCPLPDAQELARHAEKIGAGSVLCLPELYFKPNNSQELIDYLKLISEAAPNTPLLYYHNPGLSGVNINMAQFLNLSVGQIPNFHGIKYTSNDLSEGYNALKAADGRYAVTLGLGGYTFIQPSFSLGFDSAITTSLNIIPERVVQIVEALKENRHEDAIVMQEKVSTICKTIASYGPWVATHKTAMNLLTPINVGLARPPVKNLSESQQRDLEATLKKLVA